jgi:hypothetical protein
VRPLVLVLAALLALGMLSVARPPTARADTVPEQPTLTVDPTCEPTPTNSDGDVITVTVRGYSFEYGRNVTIYWNNDPAPSPADSVAVGPAGSFEVSFTVTEIGSTAYYPVYAYYSDQVISGSEVAWSSLYVPCTAPEAQIGISPDCGIPATPMKVHVDGTGFLPNLPITVTVTDLFSDTTVYGQAGPMVPADPNAVSIDIPKVRLPDTGAYRVIAVQQTSSGVLILVSPPRTATAYLVAPCSQLTATPTCGPAGSGPSRYTIQLSGVGFQPDLGLDITFDAGDVSHQPEYFYSGIAANQDGSWGPVDITPYARGPGTYDITVSQSNDSPPLHLTHATFTVDCTPGTVTLDPPCAAPQFAGDAPTSFDLNVTGLNFQPDYPVTVTFDPDRLGGLEPETTKTMALSDGSFAAQLRVAARPANTYNVAVHQQVGDTAIDTSVPFSMPCAPPSPTLQPNPTCGYELPGQPQAYSIELLGQGFIPGPVRIIFDPDGTPETFTATADAPNGAFDTTIAPTGRPAGTYRIEARQDDANGPLDDVSFDTFVVPCVNPMLAINPSTASPGFVVEVQGTAFPPGSTVELTWSYGIGASIPIEVVAGADGTFDRQVLIFPHDFTGLRQMTAGSLDDATAYPGAQASLLVTPGTGSPPGFQIFGGNGEAPIVSRH